MTDEAGSNLKRERCQVAQQGTKRKELLHILCDAHKIAAVISWSFSIMKPWDSRLIRLALSVDGMALQALRREMRIILSEQLVVMYSARPPADASCHRKAVFDMFFVRKSPNERYKRSILEGLFNGDIRKVGVVEHFENGCCKSRKDTLDQMVKYGVMCLLPKRFPVMSRSNWTGADLAIEAVGLAAAVHGLLGLSYCRAMGGPPAAPLEAATAFQYAAPNGFGEAPGRGEPDADAMVAQPAADDAAENVPDGETAEVSMWREDAASRVRQTKVWASSGAFVDEMVIAQLLYKPMSHRMLHQLSTTGVQWERHQQRKFAETGSRSYTMCLAADGEDDKRLLREASALASSPAEWGLVQRRSEDVALVVFRTTSRMGAATFDLLCRRHRHWPYKLFNILHNKEVATELAQAPECTLDPFTAGFRRRYGMENLAGDAALAELTCLAAVCQTDTASTERWHSRNQRRSRARVWTHVQDFESLSAHFLAQRSRGPVGPSESRPRPTKRPRRSQNTASDEQGGAALRTGAGGPWRAFVHIQAAGRQLTAEFAAELSQRYQALSGEEKEFYNEIGELATIAKRQGDLAFGRRIRKPIAGAADQSRGQPQLLDANRERPANVPNDAADAAVEVAPARLAQAAPPPRIVQDAIAAREDAKVDAELEKHEENETNQARPGIPKPPSPSCSTYRGSEPIPLAMLGMI